jgi:hypothetical protein
MAMVLLAFILGISVLIEWASTQATGFAGRCALPSISAYYYTPVRSLFVGSLVAIGACLVAVQGSTTSFRFAARNNGVVNPVVRCLNFLAGWITEDNALNIAGMLAPIVALVPTGQPASKASDRFAECTSVKFVPFNTSPNITNNISSLIIAGILAVVAAFFLAPQKAGLREMVGQAKSGLISAGLVLAGGYAWFRWFPSNFLVAAHFTAAIAMFVAMGLAVVSNARSASPFRKFYGSIAFLMVFAAAVILIVGRFGWKHSVLWLEAAEIALFASFWAVQTRDLWESTARETG